jgi:hypothetical protein
MLENAGFDRRFLFALQSGKPGLLKETDITPSKGKIIRMTRALLVTTGSEGSHRKLRVHNASKPDSAG